MGEVVVLERRVRCEGPGVDPPQNLAGQHREVEQSVTSAEDPVDGDLPLRVDVRRHEFQLRPLDTFDRALAWRTLGRPPRRLTRLHLEGSVETLPAHCDRVVLPDSGKVVGFVGSAARHFEDGPIAVAMLKRNVPLAATLHVSSGDVTITASQEVVVDPEAGLHVRPALG